MRELSKKLHECGSGKGDIHRIKKDVISEDSELPTYESMTKKYRMFWSGKSPDYTTVVRKFLQSKVGENWDDVYSELCSKLEDKDRECIFWYVNIYNKIDRWFAPFHVSEKGILEKRKDSSYSNYQYEKPKKRIIEFEGQEYFCYEDIWYAVTSTTETKVKTYYGRDMNIKDVFFEFNHTLAFKEYGCNRICTSKRQVNSKICKKLRDFIGE
jgi:hypothetical protein